MEDADKENENRNYQQILSDIYKGLNEMRTSHNNLIWQTPALSLTAQAFLLTISLGPSESQVSRTIASIISIMISILSVQLIERHSYFETSYSKIIEQLEKEHNYKLHFKGKELLPHARIDTFPYEFLAKKNCFSRFKSTQVWMALLLSFTVISSFIIILTWCFPWALT